MAQEKKLEKLFVETLKDMYYAEKSILKGLKKLERGADNDKLKQAFEHHREETQTHVERLEEVFSLMDRSARGKTCDAMVGLMEEGDEILEEFKNTDALDAGLIATAQAIEHYEIARYGALRSWAQQLGMKEAAEILGKTLEEEKKTDQLLTDLAEKQANREAA